MRIIIQTVAQQGCEFDSRKGCQKATKCSCASWLFFVFGQKTDRQKTVLLASTPYSTGRSPYVITRIGKGRQS